MEAGWPAEPTCEADFRDRAGRHGRRPGTMPVPGPLNQADQRIPRLLPSRWRHNSFYTMAEDLFGRTRPALYKKSYVGGPGCRPPVPLSDRWQRNQWQHLMDSHRRIRRSRPCPDDWLPVGHQGQGRPPAAAASLRWIGGVMSGQGLQNYFHRV